MVEDGFEGILAENHEVIVGGETTDSKNALGAHLELVGAFLAADV